MGVSQEESKIIQQVILPAIHDSLEEVLKNQNSISPERLKKTIEYWSLKNNVPGNISKNGFVNLIKPPIVSETLMQMAKIIGVSRNNYNDLKFTDKQFQRILKVIAVNNWERFIRTRKEESDNIKKAFKKGESQGFGKGFVSGTIFWILVAILLVKLS